ncbi:hypothetical protein [Formosa haliotis]|uniref:hypothetical protein n=1 Tax=Formosa haliotis TaxID=1555194 RepID=UPI0008247A72|nr:hypothetical protein [Formosa haliotis]
MSKLFLSCEEAAEICDRSQYEESTTWERIKLRLHVFFCGFCKEHAQKNHKLTDTIKSSNIVCLDAKSKAEMKSCLEKELKNQKL